MTTHNLIRSSMFGVMLLLLPLRMALAASPTIVNLQDQINLLQTQVSSLQTQNSTLQTQVTALQTAVASLQAASGTLATVSQYMSVETVNGHPTVRFTGANVQVVNGMGSTTTANGLGNLIIGYDEPDTLPGALNLHRCTIGANPASYASVTDETSCVAAGGEWVNTGFKTGSHYVVLGSQNNYSRWGGLIAGFQNTSNFNYASVSGGTNNTASNLYSSVSGGRGNTARGDSSSVSGGSGNTASGNFASVSGGQSNAASGGDANVTGGANNVASGQYSSVLGGYQQNATSSYETIPPVLGGTPATCTSDANCSSGDVCNEGVCTAGCVSDLNCVPTAYCSASRCVAKLAAGSACSSSSACISSICLGGVCQ